MKYLSTLIRLFKESREYATNSQNWWQIFETLCVLYLKSKFAGKGKAPVFYQFSGFKIYAYDFPTLIALYREIFLNEVYAFSSENSQPFIVDCGANIGMTVFYFKTLYPESEIWAFEPNPGAFELLEKNVKINGIQDVKLFHCALSDVEGQLDFYIPAQRGSLNASSQNNSSSHQITVEGKQLSKLLPDRVIDLIKIDIEGDEVKVVKDLHESKVLRSVRELVIEYHPHKQENGDDANALVAYLTSKGFFCQQRASHFGGQLSRDLIFCFRKG